MKVLLATQNRGKVKELQDLLSGEEIEVLSLEDLDHWEEVEETGSTFAENAAMKARIAAQRTGLVSLADDSGLEVDALQGAPGVYSARYAGEPKDDDKNNDRLLQELEGVPEEQRTGRFRCALVIAAPTGEEYLTEGTVEGRILNERRGKEGFGYDPLFYLPDFGRTMAQLNLSQKNKISHRAEAFRQAVPILKEFAQRNEKA
ncbi:non-canonical purine NTP pyrophosphatase, rdgB/HAM1 family [Desulfitobacterium dehalogenans ATCC 51507]|uniref:dITP/XTP pyrophosphatase n=1 Tax=Desulfitobacterium dehalogenans (strain ATCC 51507 / DSM 9161 / JW/IU-DC1) TaxID=756499 RepID=I4ADJ9_DESDJ|nr:XTP/dITP diphosphatase [Desulfitobacterium dehalogenans]AFM02034.1 non-canonical purine NTP pyrophosphatase, rdgB/HAM1 family [Desulfitobacterium dehalogenans ATCC 51507]